MIAEDWNRAGAYAYVDQLEVEDLAWEFLRRNPAYQADHATVTRLGDRGTDGVARRWGLRPPG